MSQIQSEAGSCSAMGADSCGSKRRAEKVSARLMLAGHAAQIVGLAGMCVLLFLNQ